MGEILSSFAKPIYDIIDALWDSVLTPALTEALKFIFGTIVTLVTNVLKEVLYTAFQLILTVMNFLETIIGFFAGIDQIKLNGKEESLLEAFFSLSTVTYIMFGMCIVAFAVTFALSIHGSLSLVTDEAERKPISAVLRNLGLAWSRIFTVFIVCILLVQLSGAVLKSYRSINQTGSGTIANSIFVAVARPALKTNDAAEQGKIISDYMDAANTTRKFDNFEQVKSDFNMEKFQFFFGYLFSLVTIFCLIGAALTCLRRVFDLLVLYMIGPAFAASSVLKEDQRYLKWRRLFVAKFVGVLGPVIGLELYFQISNFIIGANIEFASNPTLNTAVTLIILSGMSFAMYKSQTLIYYVVSQDGWLLAESGQADASFLLRAGSAAMAAK